jgi:hypothetical protein
MYNTPIIFNIVLKKFKQIEATLYDNNDLKHIRKDMLYLQEEIDECKNRDITNQITVSFWIDNGNGLINASHNLSSIFEKATDHHEEVLKRISEKDFNIITKKALKYAVNVANILTTQVDKEYYTNPDRDIRIYQDNRSVKKEDRDKNQKLVIKVFGETKKIAEQYNKDKKTHGGLIDATHVSGHWRHYKSERYTIKQGSVEWIKPFYKGKDRELYSKAIKIISKKE